jgi:hypothetical protein
MAENNSEHSPQVPLWLYLVVLGPLSLVVALVIAEPLRARLARRLPWLRRSFLLGLLGFTVVAHGAEAIWIGRRAARSGLAPGPWIARTLAIGSFALIPLQQAEAEISKEN